MRFLITLLLIAALSAVAQLLLPWWTIAVIAFTVALFSGLRPGRAFGAGFFGISIFWLIAILLRDIPNDHILSARMAILFRVGSYPVFILVTVLVGGLLGGLAAWSGALFGIRK
jgi:hypothetical protein